jgi:energy-coupling factor transporter ATP-binding protein EcfA2
VDALLSVSGLSYEYPDGTRALSHVDFSLHAGETVAVFGANGSGKTTFVLHLNGILSGSGRIVVGGVPLEPPHVREARRKIGIVFQDPDDQLFMPTVIEDVAFGPLAAGVPLEEAIAAAKVALARVGIHDGLDKPPYHLSAGEKRRVAIAGVLASNAEILVLDEPTTFLDPPAQRALIRTLKQLPQAKIVVTHDAAFARAIATRAVFFQSGTIVAEASVDALVSRFGWSAE